MKEEFFMTNSIGRIQQINNVNSAPESKAKPEAEKTSKQIEDGDKKMLLALAGLAVLSAGAIIVHKKIPKTAENVAKEAVKEVQNGANYANVRKEATKNFDKEGKKVIKEALNNAHNEIRAQEKIAQVARKANVETTINAQKTVQNIGQGMQSKTAEEAKLAAETAVNAAKTAAEQAKQMAITAEKNGTHKNKKIAQFLQNQAVKVNNEANKKVEKSKEQIAKLEEAAVKKAENIAKAQASPGYASGQVKMAENAAKTLQNSAKRELKQIRSQGAYKNAMQKIRHKSPEQLKKMLNENTNNKHMRQAILDTLENLEKTVM